MIIENKPLLRIEDLHVYYEQKGNRNIILNGISFELKRGEILSLLGESGSGKSTIAKAITGLLPPSAQIENGIIQLADSDSIALAKRNINWQGIRGREIAMIFQDARQALNPMLTVKEHFKETLLFHRLATADEVVAISTELLSSLNFSNIPKLLDSYPFQLSGGMCQRVCVALTLCMKPSLIIADEPTSALDTVSQKEVLDILKKVQTEFNQTILIITHDIAVAHTVSDRILVLNKGEIVEEGTPETVLSTPKQIYTQQLLASRSCIECYVKNEATKVESPLLTITGLEKKFNRKNYVLKDVNLTLHKNEILGIIGQSGCGKSTLSKCIVGIEQPDRGQILYANTNICCLKGKQKRAICQNIQMIFQDARASLNPRYNAVQLTMEPLQYLNLGNKKEREELARFYLNEVGIVGDAQERRPPQLSTGQCQRIAIARALIVKPDILICDEAVSALDMSIQTQILELLQRLHQQLGFSILMISHDIRVLRNFCDRIAVMNEGSFCEVRNGGSCFNESCHPYTQSLLQCEYEMNAKLEV